MEEKVKVERKWDPTTHISSWRKKLQEVPLGQFNIIHEVCKENSRLMML